jgi:hypothetical protein
MVPPSLSGSVRAALRDALRIGHCHALDPGRYGGNAMETRAKEYATLRELGKRVAEIASLPVNRDKKELWKSLNSLKPVRPMVNIDQIPWHEMNVDDELTVTCTDPFLRYLEQNLRTTLYRWKHMRADMVVEPVIRVPKLISNTGFGLKVSETIAVTDSLNSITGHSYHDQLETDEDLRKIRTPEVHLDEKGTSRCEEIAREVFDGILDVQLNGTTPFFNLWDLIVQLHGVENTLVDLVCRPEFMHEMTRRFTDAYLGMLDQMEEQGLLANHQDTVHCSGAYTDELPAPGYDPSKPRCRDIWTFGMSQIFATVSPQTHKEYDIDYSVEWYRRFGLVYYGCCEPLHDKIDIIREIPNVRKISISPWADVEKSALQIGGDYVVSIKPSPAYLATDAWDPESVRMNLEDISETCKRHGCPFEFILKDISTVRYQPQRLWEWEKIAMEVVGG